jgi:mRNA interferase MazF
MSSEVDATEAFRPVVLPTRLNGLRSPTMVMTDKIVAVRRERLRRVIGRLADEDTGRLEQALLLILGLAR